MLAQNAQHAPQRIGVDLVVDAHAFARTEFNLDRSGGAASTARSGVSTRMSIFSRTRRLRDLNRQQYCVHNFSPHLRSRLSPPSEEQALRDTMPTSNF